MSIAIAGLSLIEGNYGAAIEELENRFGGELMAWRITSRAEKHRGRSSVAEFNYKQGA